MFSENVQSTQSNRDMAVYLDEVSLRHVRHSKSSTQDGCTMNDFEKSIEFRDIVYAVFQGRGLRRFEFR